MIWSEESQDLVRREPGFGPKRARIWSQEWSIFCPVCFRQIKYTFMKKIKYYQHISAYFGNFWDKLVFTLEPTFKAWNISMKVGLMDLTILRFRISGRKPRTLQIIIMRGENDFYKCLKMILRRQTMILRNYEEISLPYQDHCVFLSVSVSVTINHD